MGLGAFKVRGWALIEDAIGAFAGLFKRKQKRCACCGAPADHKPEWDDSAVDPCVECHQVPCGCPDE